MTDQRSQPITSGSNLLSKESCRDSSTSIEPLHSLVDPQNTEEKVYPVLVGLSGATEEDNAGRHGIIQVLADDSWDEIVKKIEQLGQDGSFGIHFRKLQYPELSVRWSSNRECSTTSITNTAEMKSVLGLIRVRGCMDEIVAWVSRF